MIEARLRFLIESIATIFPDKDPLELLVHKLVVCMQSNLKHTSDGRVIAPDHFIITLSPEKKARYFDKEAWLPVLSNALEQVALENGQSFASHPTFSFQIDETFSGKKIVVDCQVESHELSETSSIRTHQDSDSIIDLDAYLIVEGGQVFPLPTGAINIGRRQDNELVINNPHVSRLHAQIRSCRGTYVIFDLNSSSGTYVNGQRIDKRSLKSGDVISLGGTTLIYSEESAANEKPSALSSTNPIRKDHKGKIFS